MRDLAATFNGVRSVQGEAQRAGLGITVIDLEEDSPLVT